MGEAEHGEGRAEVVHRLAHSVEHLARLVRQRRHVALHRGAHDLLVPELAAAAPARGSLVSGGAAALRRGRGMVPVEEMGSEGEKGGGSEF